MKEAIEYALENLQCNQLNCWCFTRAVMKEEDCKCDNCDVWRKLNAVMVYE